MPNLSKEVPDVVTLASNFNKLFVDKVSTIRKAIQDRTTKAEEVKTDCSPDLSPTLSEFLPTNRQEIEDILKN